MPHKHEQGSPSQSHLSHIQPNPASHKASAHWSFQCHTKDPKCDDYVRIQRRPKLKAVGGNKTAGKLQNFGQDLKPNRMHSMESSWTIGVLWCFASSYLCVQQVLGHKNVCRFSGKSGVCLVHSCKSQTTSAPQFSCTLNMTQSAVKKIKKTRKPYHVSNLSIYIHQREREPGPENELKTAQTRSVSDKEMRPSWEGTLALVKIKERDVKNGKDTKGKLTSSFFWSYE